MVPGEAAAEAMYRQITAAALAIERHDAPALARALAEQEATAWQEPGTASLQRALAAMARAIAEARADPCAVLGGEGGARWLASAVAAGDRVVRKSVEMRAVAWLSRIDGAVCSRVSVVADRAASSRAIRVCRMSTAVSGRRVVG